MNLSKEYVNLYDNYLKYINEVNKEVRSIKNMKKRVLKGAILLRKMKY